MSAGCSSFSKDFVFPDEGPLARFLAEPVSESDIEREFGREDSLEFPVRAAAFELVYDEPGEPPRANRNVDALLDLMARDAGRFESATRITPLFLDGKPTLPRLRLAAAQSQSGLLVVTEIDRRVRSEATPLVLLNLLLVGLFLPSETVAVDLRIQAHLVDARTGRFLGACRATAEGERFVPTLSVEEAAEELLEELSHAAYAHLMEGIARRLDALALPRSYSPR